MLVKDKELTIETTGYSTRKSFNHRVHTDSHGVPCPVLCYLEKGRLSERFVYQILNDTKGFLITSEGNELTQKNNIEIWGKWEKEDLDVYKVGLNEARKVSFEVVKWKTDGICHFPPGYKRPITPELFDPSLIEESMHTPWMFGSFILYGGGKGLKVDNLFISKLWKLSQPHINNWDDPIQKSFGKKVMLNIGRCSISADTEIEVVKELGNSFLCKVPNGTDAIVTLMDEHGIADSTTVRGLFRCGAIDKELS